ncbi:hypothetical protein TrVE_jg432, partial [Triparma verrucosa]
MPFPMRQRDFVYTEYNRKEANGDILVCSRSSKDVNAATTEFSVKAGRIRAEICLAGYRLRPLNFERTEITYIHDVDYRGVFVLNYFYRKAMSQFLMGIVDMHLKQARDSSSEPADSAPPPLIIISKAFEYIVEKGGAKGRRLTTNPMIAGLGLSITSSTSDIEDGLNIEMGRIIKKAVTTKSNKLESFEEDNEKDGELMINNPDKNKNWLFSKKPEQKPAQKVKVSSSGLLAVGKAKVEPPLEKKKNKKDGDVVVAKLENEIVKKGKAIAKELMRVDSKGLLAKRDNEGSAGRDRVRQSKGGQRTSVVGLGSKTLLLVTLVALLAGGSGAEAAGISRLGFKPSSTSAGLVTVTSATSSDYVLQVEWTWVVMVATYVVAVAGALVCVILKVCGAGKFSPVGGWYDCFECASGTYSLAGAGECPSCEAGKSSSPGSSSCEDCEAGMFGDGGPCADCPEGTSSPPSSASCAPCELGKYNDDKGQGSCLLCGQGKYLDFTGAVSETQCKVCDIGKYNDSPGLGTDCPDCQKGKFAAATGYALCRDCITGTYASELGSEECTQCEVGKHSQVTGSETCDDCAAGSFTNYRGAVVCTFCSGGKYSSEGASVCLDCGQATYSNPGSSSCDTCEHTQGFVAKGEGNNECVYCGPGEYADLPTHE